MPTYTPKEAEVYTRFGEQMQKALTNPNQSIATSIEELAKKIPDKKALLYEDSSWTWQEFNEESNLIANHFLNSGLEPSDTVALMFENSPEYLFYTTGINKLQGVSALINFNLRKQALIHSFKLAEPKWIIVDGDSLPYFIEIVKDLDYPNENVYVINNNKNSPHDFANLQTITKNLSKSNPDTTYNSILHQNALYIYTSGTTGLPKACVMENFKLFTQGNFLGIAFAKMDINDIVYLPTPLYHNLAIGVAWPAIFRTGATLAIRKSFSASEYWKDIHKFQATYTIYVGEIPRYLLNQPPSEYEKNHTLKKMLGIGLRKEIWEKFQSRFQIEHILEFYGLTEGHRTLVNVEEIPGMIGRLTQSGLILVKVNPETGEFYRNESGYCIKCKPGDIGMVLLKIDKGTFFTGYTEKEKTEVKFQHNVFLKDDTYFNTNDMLMLHDDLWVSFADRFGDTYRWKGENVSTLEIESILNSYPSINLSAVYGVHIPNTEGKAGMAAIKLNPAVKFEIEHFSRFIVDVFPIYSIPVFIRICEDELEITGPYKIKKTNLQLEGYDIEFITDILYLWDQQHKMYIFLDNDLYQKLIKGQFRI
ncbi:MAG: AMP-binding protein [Candidatus Lokiarchaeota archaeon]|nr:AMP-binding protein [Candidatus Lokiarchaeota archaeon]